MYGLFDSTLIFDAIKYSLYIDPGAFHTILVMLMGGLVGIGVAIKTYWYRIKIAFSRK